jgi:hypothetical protein
MLWLRTPFSVVLSPRCLPYIDIVKRNDRNKNPCEAMKTFLVDEDDFFPYPNILFFVFLERMQVQLSQKIVSIIQNRLCFPSIVTHPTFV